VASGPSLDAAAGDAVVVDGYAERWLRRGFPWVYKKEVTERTGSLSSGQVVTIRTRQGVVLGSGIWDEGNVEVRRYRMDDGPVDAPLLRSLAKAALARRTLPPDTTAWRWIHGENDDLPGVRVDVWGADLALTLDARSLESILEVLVDVLVAEAPFEVRAVWLDWRPHEGEETAVAKTICLWGAGQPDGDLVVLERGIKVGVRPWVGHDAGMFCDMRGLRTWLEPHWTGRHVLNTFAYTGLFSVAAAVHGAASVTTVDLSAPSLDRAQENFALNGLDPSGHSFVAEDTFRALDTLRRKDQQFDLVIADPPSHSRGPHGEWSVQQHLARLVAACLRVLRPGGWLVIATNHGKMSPKDFQGQIQAGALKADRSLRLLHQGSPPMDFPAALAFPESRYLKCWVLEA